MPWCAATCFDIDLINKGPGYVNFEISGNIAEGDNYDIWSDATPTGPGSSVTMVGDAIYDGTNGKCYDSSYESEICQVAAGGDSGGGSEGLVAAVAIESGEMSGLHPSAYAEMGNHVCGNQPTNNWPVSWLCDSQGVEQQIMDNGGPLFSASMGDIGDADTTGFASIPGSSSGLTMTFGYVDIVFSCYSQSSFGTYYTGCPAGPARMMLYAFGYEKNAINGGVQGLSLIHI